MCFGAAWLAIPTKAECLSVTQPGIYQWCLLFLTYCTVCVPSTSANHPRVSNWNKKPRTNSAIHTWLGAYFVACQQTQGRAAKSVLKSKPAQRGLPLHVGLSVLQHAVQYVHRGRAASHVSVFLCICLAVFSRAPSYSISPSLALSHRGLSPLLPAALLSHCAPVTGVSAPKKLPLVLDSFKMTCWLLKCYD